MNLGNSNESWDKPRSNNIFRHTGFRVGFVGGFLMVMVHLVLLLLNVGTNRGDWIGWFVGWFVYFFASRVAAEQHYRAQQGSLEHLRGVEGAGVGAALVTFFIVWIFIILRAVFRDALGITILVEPISLFCIILIDGLFAVGLGAAGGRTVAKKYSSFTGY